MLLPIVHAELWRVRNPERAKGAQAYMKSEMPFIGVPMPILRAICKRIFREHPVASAEEWRAEVLDLWRNAKCREERYAAVELAAFHRRMQTMDALPVYEEMIVTGAWWDYVDIIAAHDVGGLLRAHPREMKPIMRAWSRDADLWKRRTSILCQLTFKDATDLELLYDCIAPSLASKEFFLRKAIGWALRQYAKFDPKEVRRYVTEHEAALSSLSKREALKNLT